MFRAKTVFVVGAGASAEFGFPLGAALLDDIARRVDISYEFGRLKRGDYTIVEALRNSLDANANNQRYNEHLHTASQIVKSSKQGLSIDNVLDALEDEKAALVGKFGIVRSILAAEESSPLSQWIDHFPEQIDISSFSNTWLDGLTKILIEGRRKSQIENIFENLTIINFNYDRVIEHYLPFAISNFYGLKTEAVREVMSRLPIYRPYGKAGTLPWERSDGAVKFGHCSADDMAVATSQILTFTEQVEDTNLVDGIRGAVKAADRIVFVGFGFHRQNLDLMACAASKHVGIFGTSFGMSKSDTMTVSEDLEKLFGLDEYQTHRDHDYTKLYPLKCSDFVSEIRRTLTSYASEDPTWELPDFSEPRTPSIPSLSFGNR